MANRLDVYRRDMRPRTLEDIFDEMQRSFDEWMRPFYDSMRSPLIDRIDGSLGRIPRADIEENDTEYVVTAEMPGIPKENIEVRVTDDNVLEIRGKHTSEKKETKGHYVRQERQMSDYFRSFALDTPVDTDKVEAHVENGVLTLHLPKKQTENKNYKKIEIK
ncbi:MAG: Hsp20/alpha crystallin family protein [Methanomassiliicoccales archaeon]